MIIAVTDSDLREGWLPMATSRAERRGTTRHQAPALERLLRGPRMMEDAGTVPPEQPDAASSASLPSALVWLVLSSRSMDAMLNILVSLAPGTMAEVDGASVSVLRGRRFATVAASSDDVLDADKAQYDSGRGPCIQATQRSETINVGLVETRSRWPEFAEIAVSAGYRSVLATPMATGAPSVGALTLYSRSPGPFDDTHERAAQAFADQVAVVLDDTAALAEVAALATADMLHRRLSEALVTRDLVGWATGMYMAGRQCSPDEAFDVLRQTSMQSGRTLRDLAENLVTAAAPSRAESTNAELPVGVLETARHRSGYSVIELWIAYFAIGGRGSVADLQAVLAGRAQPARRDHDRLAQALNERLADLDVGHLVPYFDELVS